MQAKRSWIFIPIRNPISHQRKADNSPLTKADKKAHAIISMALSVTPFPVLSEEGKEKPFAERSGWDMLWIVDPLDGTKEFIKKNGEFTVNIALVKEGVPVLGVIYVPCGKSCISRLTRWERSSWRR